MEKVQVDKTIPEVSLAVGPLFVSHLTVMTVETEGVVLFVERQVEAFRKVLFQQMGIGGAVDCVAGRAIIICYRFMNR